MINLTGQHVHGSEWKLPSRLRDAILTDAVITEVDFSNVDLSGIHAPRVHFHKCNFTNATFKHAYLRAAKFTQSVFEDTDLWGVSGDGVYIISLQLGGYDVCYTSEILQINCKQFDIKKIWWMQDEDVLAHAQKGNTHGMGEMAAWWSAWKYQIYQIVNNNPAKPVTMGR